MSEHSNSQNKQQKILSLLWPICLINASISFITLIVTLFGQNTLEREFVYLGHQFVQNAAALAEQQASLQHLFLTSSKSALEQKPLTELFKETQSSLNDCYQKMLSFRADFSEELSSTIGATKDLALVLREGCAAVTTAAELMLQMSSRLSSSEQEHFTADHNALDE